MGLGDLLKRAADTVVQGATVSYYFVYYLIKGHENEESKDNQQQLCIDSRPVRPGSSASTTGPATNVCCLHGVQTKPAQYGHVPPAAPPTAKKPEHAVGTHDTQGATGWLSWLNPKNWFSKQEEKAHHDRPVVPPRHFKPGHEHVPNGAHAEPHGQEQSQPLLEKLWSYVPSLGKKAEAEPERPPSPISTRRILRVVTMPGPGTSDHLQTSYQQQTQSSDQSDFIHELKHAVEPHYPATYSHDQDPYRPTISVRSGVEYAPSAPPAPPPANFGPASVQIHAKPKQPTAVKPDDAWVTSPSGLSEVQRPAIWTPSSIPQPHAASSVQVRMQRQSLRKTTTTENSTAISPTPYEPDDQQKSVRELKRQWPPPSNATGVEIVKELVFPTGAPGGLSNAIIADGDTQFNYEAYRPTNMAESSDRTTYDERRVGEYSGGQQDYSEPRRDERSAISPERFRELSHELTSKSSAGKGVELFVRRRQKMENWMNEEEQQPPPRPTVPSSVQRMVPVAAPRKRVSANEVVDSVVEAASRKEHHWQPVEHVPRPEVSSPIRRELERVVSPTPPVPSWRKHERHERFFSPQPFSSTEASRERLFTPPPRTHEPKVLQQAHRSTSVLGDRMEQKEFIDWKSGPDMTTTVVSASTPSSSRTMTTSTYAASRGSQYTKTSSYNTLPRTWKAYSEAYQQAR